MTVQLCWGTTGNGGMGNEKWDDILHVWLEIDRLGDWPATVECGVVWRLCAGVDLPDNSLPVLGCGAFPSVPRNPSPEQLMSACMEEISYLCLQGLCDFVQSSF